MLGSGALSAGATPSAVATAHSPPSPSAIAAPEIRSGASRVQIREWLSPARETTQTSVSLPSPAAEAWGVVITKSRASPAIRVSTMRTAPLASWNSGAPSRLATERRVFTSRWA